MKIIKLILFSVFIVVAGTLTIDKVYAEEDEPELILPSTYRGSVTIGNGASAEGMWITAQMIKSDGSVYTTKPVQVKNGKYFMMVVSPGDSDYKNQIIKFYLDGIIEARETDRFVPGRSGTDPATGMQFGPYIFDLSFSSVPTPTPTPTATPTMTPTPTATPLSANPAIFAGSVVIAGMRVQEGSTIYATIGDYQSLPAIIEKDDTYRNLVVDPNDYRAFGKTIYFYLNGVQSRTTRTYISGSINKDFDLIFVGVPTFTPTPSPTATFTPTPTNTSTPTPTRTATPTNVPTATSTNTATPTYSPTPTVTPTYTSTPTPASPSFSVDKIDNKSTSTENSGGQCFGPMNVSLATGIGNSFLMLAPVFFLAGYVRTVKKKKRSN